MKKLNQLPTGRWQWENKEFDTKQEAIKYGQSLQIYQLIEERKRLAGELKNLQILCDECHKSPRHLYACKKCKYD